jgi:hypothetical protein
VERYFVELESHFRVKKVKGVLSGPRDL